MSKQKETPVEPEAPKSEPKAPGQCSKPDCASTKIGADVNYVCPAHGEEK